MKFLSILLACLLTLSLTACNSTTSSQNNNKPGNQNTGSSGNSGNTGNSGNAGDSGNTGNTGNAGNTQNGTGTDNTTPDILPGKDDNMTGNENPTEKPDMMPDDTNNANGTGSNQSGQNGSTNSSSGQAGQADAAKQRRFIYNGNHYEVTDEVLSEDEVGIELFSIMNIVTDMPAKEGDAMGLDEGTRVFRLDDDNEYDEIAVEIGGVYYKAVQKD